MELVNNIMKHSSASKSKIELSQLENQIKMTVADNGIGTFKNDSDGRGLKNVQARVDSIGGTWTVKSIEGEGVVNEIWV
jgi:two-component system, NarL family, sensor histidine kinase LiaS